MRKILGIIIALIVFLYIWSILPLIFSTRNNKSLVVKCDPQIFDSTIVRDHITTRLDFGKKNYPKAVDYSKKVFERGVQCVSEPNFADGLDFSESFFNDDASFKNSTISGTADFANSQFTSSAFDGAVFNNGVQFGSAEFLDDASFDSTVFKNNSANFGHTVFRDTAEFSDASFADTADFGKSRFCKWTRFTSANFHREAYFENSIFGGYTDFSGIHIDGELNFHHSNFKASRFLDLSYMAIGDKSNIIFEDAILPDTVLFAEDYNFKPDIYLNAANFTDSSRFDYKSNKPIPVYLYLLNTSIAKIHIDYTHFKLCLPDSTIHKDSDRKRKFISDDQKTGMYEALLNNFKINGQDDSYELLDREYQDFRWKKHWWSYWLSPLPKIWWNYGYDKEYVFMWILGLLTLFTIRTYFIIYDLNTKVYKIKSIVLNEQWAKKRSVNDFQNRLWNSFIYTSIVFFTLGLKVEEMKFGDRGKAGYLLVVYTLGLVCLAYTANFVLQK